MLSESVTVAPGCGLKVGEPQTPDWREWDHRAGVVNCVIGSEGETQVWDRPVAVTWSCAHCCLKLPEVMVEDSRVFRRQPLVIELMPANRG